MGSNLSKPRFPHQRMGLPPIPVMRIKWGDMQPSHTCPAVESAECLTSSCSLREASVIQGTPGSAGGSILFLSWPHQVSVGMRLQQLTPKSFTYCCFLPPVAAHSRGCPLSRTAVPPLVWHCQAGPPPTPTPSHPTQVLGLSRGYHSHTLLVFKPMVQAPLNKKI